jgi:hypothetical protein
MRLTAGLREMWIWSRLTSKGQTCCRVLFPSVLYPKLSSCRPTNLCAAILFTMSSVQRQCIAKEAGDSVLHQWWKNDVSLFLVTVRWKAAPSERSKTEVN